MAVLLHIDTANKDKLVVKLIDDQQEIAVLSQAAAGRSHDQALLASIDRLLRQNHFSMSQLDGIEVHCGPGSFTGTRVGVALANSLGLALAIPVNNQPVGQSVSVIYASAPHISQPINKKISPEI